MLIIRDLQVLYKLRHLTNQENLSKTMLIQQHKLWLLNRNLRQPKLQMLPRGMLTMSDKHSTKKQESEQEESL